MSSRGRTSRTQARQLISVKCCSGIWSHLAIPPELQQGGLLFGEFPKLWPIPWKRLGSRPYHLLILYSLKNQQEFLWQAANACHKSAHLTKGPPTYLPPLHPLPDAYSAGAKSHTRKEAGVLTGAPDLRRTAGVLAHRCHASAALRLDLSLVLLQPAGKPDACERPRVHVGFTRKSTSEINQLWKCVEPMFGSVLPWPVQKNDTAGACDIESN